MARTGRNQRENGGKGESVAGGRELQQQVQEPPRAQAGGSRDVLTSGPPPAAGRMVRPDSPLRAAVV